MKILYDVIDVCMMRFKPLAEYQYPLWQVLALLAGVSLAVSPMAQLLHTDILSRAVFLFSMKLAQYAVMARFFRLWLQIQVGDPKRPLSAWDGQGSLFVFLVMVQGIDFLQPMLLWTEGSFQALLAFALFGYSMTLLLRGMAHTTGGSMRVIIGGLLLCAPLLVMVGMLFGAMALGWGWIHPQDLMPAAVPPAATPGG